MKNKFFIFLFCLSTFSCKKENMGDCFKSTGKIKEEARSIAPFNEIFLDDRVNLFITYDQQLSLKVKAGENLQEHIITEVKGKTLTIKNDNRCNWVRSFKKEINVYLTTPSFKEFTYYGSGKVHFLNQFVADTLLFNLWEASGDLQLNVQTEYIELKTHSGVGTITSKGEAKELVAFVGGNGFVDASNTISNRVLAVNENTGYIKVNAIDYLKAEIKRNGNIEYIGNPIIDLIDQGSGQLIKIDN